MMETVQSISQVAAAALIAGLWQGIVLAVAIWIGLKLAPRATAGLRFAIWTAVFAAIALLSVVAMVPSYANTTLPAPSAASIHPLQLDSRWALGITAVWLSFAAVRLVELGGSALRARNIWKRATPLDAAPAIQSLLQKSGVGHTLLCASPDVDQPCVVGFVSQRILVPGWLLDKATAAELEQIVLHELSHLRRFDNWTNLLQKLVAAILPLNPALLWVERRLCAERELACDERVVRATRAPRDYATCLTNLAGEKIAQNIARRETALPGALSLGAWERRSQLAGRIESILRGGHELSPLKAGAIMAALLVATGGGALKLSRSAQFVSFTSPDSEQAEVHVAPQSLEGAHDRYVAYHASSSAAAQPARAELVTTRTAPSVAKSRAKMVARNTLRRDKAAPGKVQTFFIVTRWQDSSGQQMTVVDRFVRVSALSAAQASSGWFVVQL